MTQQQWDEWTDEEALDLIELAASEVALVSEEIEAAVRWRDTLIYHAVNQGLSLRKVAERAGVSHQTVARIAATSP